MNHIVRFARALLLAAIAVVCASVAQATTFGDLKPGLPVADGLVKIGLFEVQLPPGEWTVAAAAEVQAGSTSFATASPRQQRLWLVRLDGSRLAATLMLRSPSATFVGTSKWNDDPCGQLKEPLMKDTLKQTYAWPECLAVTKTSVGDTKGTGDFAKWLDAKGTNIPESLVRVMYAKYYMGDFLYAYLTLPATPADLAPIEKWGRSAAAALAPVVTRDSKLAVLPPLPEPAAQ